MKLVHLVQVVSLAYLIPGVVALPPGVVPTPTTLNPTSQAHTNQQLDKRGFWSCWFDKCNAFRGPPPGVRSKKKETFTFQIPLPYISPNSNSATETFRRNREVFDTTLTPIPNGVRTLFQWRPAFNPNLASASITLSLDVYGGPAVFPVEGRYGRENVFVSYQTPFSAYIIPSATFIEAWRYFNNQPGSSESRPMLTVTYTILTKRENDELR